MIVPSNQLQLTQVRAERSRDQLAPMFGRSGEESHRPAGRVDEGAEFHPSVGVGVCAVVGELVESCGCALVDELDVEGCCVGLVGGAVGFVGVGVYAEVAAGGVMDEEAAGEGCEAALWDGGGGGDACAYGGRCVAGNGDAAGTRTHFASIAGHRDAPCTSAYCACGVAGNSDAARVHADSGACAGHIAGSPDAGSRGRQRRAKTTSRSGVVAGCRLCGRHCHSLAVTLAGDRCSDDGLERAVALSSRCDCDGHIADIRTASWCRDIASRRRSDDGDR